MYLLSHPENWEWGDDVNKDLTVQEAIIATLYALKLWARLSLPWFAFGLRFLLEFSKENPSFPYIVLTLICIIVFLYYTDRKNQLVKKLLKKNCWKVVFDGLMTILR